MKLYYYSGESLNFADAKWIKAKFIIGGILMGIIILFCAIEPDQSIAKALGYYTTNTLPAENNFLRYQVNFISARVNKLEMQAKRLNERAHNLHLLANSSKTMEDTVSNLSNAADGLKSQLLISAGRSLSP